MSRSAINRGIAEMEPLSPGRRRRLARSALLLVLLLVVGGSGLWLRGRLQAEPPAARPVAARPARVDVAEAAADAERRLEKRTWRLRVTTHPPGASLSIRAAGGATRRAIRLGEHGAVEVLFTGGELQRIDLASGKARTLLHTGGAMRHLVGDREGERLYAGDMGTNEAFVVDLASERVRRLAATDNLPNTIDLTADGRVLYVSNRGRNGASYYLPGPEWGSVLAIDTASGKVLDAIVGGNQTTGLDVSADGRLLAFSDFLDNRIHVYAVPSYAALAAGGGGRAVAHRAELAKR
jgi:hypothetical protein